MTIKNPENKVPPILDGPYPRTWAMFHAINHLADSAADLVAPIFSATYLGKHPATQADGTPADRSWSLERVIYR